MVGQRTARMNEIEPPRSSLRGGSIRCALASVVTVCILSRLLTSIHYVEDIDSLHFALSMVDFDLARLQPHFPGYLVFVALARTLAAITGSFAVAFALVGGIATALLLAGVLALARWRLMSIEGGLLALAVVGNGMLWLYGNRYMPDLLGTALLVWSLHDLTSQRDALRTRGAFIAALLAGTRLSYLPFLIPAALWSLAQRGGRGRIVAALVAGAALWIVPLVALTGWDEIVAIGMNQTTGHFDEFGGTVRTEPDLLRRAARMLEGAWTDMLGGYLKGRGVLTLIAGGTAMLGLALSIPLLTRSLRERRWQLIAVGAAAYLVWIFLFQNVIHHSRHLLPLAPFLLLAIAAGLARLARLHSAGAATAATLLLITAFLGARLAWQHREPSAIAQASRFLAAERDSLTVVSTALVNYYLSSTGVRARFIAVDGDAVTDSLRGMGLGARVMSVGDYRSKIARPVSSTHRFYHNPHVNRIWPRIEVYEFRSMGEPR
jgi:hypothetical protein